MKISRQCLLLFAAVVMFCAAISIGCDVSSNNDNTASTYGRDASNFSLTFSDNLGHSANNVVVLSGGKYSATNLDNVYRQDINNGQRRNNYTVRTMLQKIPDDTVESINLVAGNWKVVSASLQVRGSNLKYVLYDPNMKLIPRNDRLYWTNNIAGGQDTSFNQYQFRLTFLDNFMNSKIVELLDPTARTYKMLTPYLYDTENNGTLVLESIVTAKLERIQ